MASIVVHSMLATKLFPAPARSHQFIMGAIAPDSFKAVPRTVESEEAFRALRQQQRYLTHLWYRTDPGGDGTCIDLQAVADVARQGEPVDFWRGVAAHLALDTFWSRIVWKDYGLSSLPAFYTDMRRLDVQMVRLYPKAVQGALAAIRSDAPLVSGRSDLVAIFRPDVLKSWNEWCERDIQAALSADPTPIVPTMSPRTLRKAWSRSVQWMMSEGLL